MFWFNTYAVTEESSISRCNIAIIRNDNIIDYTKCVEIELRSICKRDCRTIKHLLNFISCNSNLIATCIKSLCSEIIIYFECQTITISSAKIF